MSGAKWNAHKLWIFFARFARPRTEALSELGLGSSREGRNLGLRGRFDHRIPQRHSGRRLVIAPACSQYATSGPNRLSGKDTAARPRELSANPHALLGRLLKEEGS
jgi:hypothetical protein